EKAPGSAERFSLVEQETEYQTWGVAWVALERALCLLADEATRAQARDLARLAAAIAGYLGASYHPDSVADLKALAHAAAAAAEPPGADALETLRKVAAAMTALDRGTGDPSITRDVTALLSRVLRQEAA